MLLLSSADFSKITFKKILSGTLSECQTNWVQTKTDVLSVLIWVQAVRKVYQQRTKVAASKESLNPDQRLFSIFYSYSMFLLVLIWVQTVCKGYQQITNVPDGKERVIPVYIHHSNSIIVVILANVSLISFACVYNHGQIFTASF